MADGVRRLSLVAHGPTAAASRLVFGADAPLLRPGPAAHPGPDAPLACCGPERACLQTAESHGRRPAPVAELRDPDPGRWRGRPLNEVAETDPDGLQQWLTDPTARPHGGETLAELVARVAAVLARPVLATGPELWVATPMVVRALTVAALRAPPPLLLALDVAFGGRVLLTASGGRWRLQGLARAAAALDEDVSPATAGSRPPRRSP